MHLFVYCTQTKAKATVLKGMILEGMVYIRILHGTNVPSQGMDSKRIAAEVHALYESFC